MYVHNQLLAEALLNNEVGCYISVCVKVGIIGKVEIRMQVSKKVFGLISVLRPFDTF